MSKNQFFILFIYLFIFFFDKLERVQTIVLIIS